MKKITFALQIILVVVAFQSCNFLSAAGISSQGQPVKEVKKRKVEIIYLGFEINPNKGLLYTTDRTILIRNSEIMDTYNVFKDKSK